jgi:CheY-like chemotaxis protein
MSDPTIILSVDDDAVNQTVIEILLEGSGYQVLQAMDGVEALEVLEKCERLPDLALVDVMMPRMSGYELCRKLREIYPPYFPIIMISAKSSKEDIIQGLECRCNDYVTKPFDKEELLARIDTLLKLNRMRIQQERKDCLSALRRMAVPKFPTPLPLNEPFQVMAVQINSSLSDSINPFLEFLAKKFELVPIPNRIGGVFMGILPIRAEIQATSSLVAFMRAVFEYCNTSHKVTCFIAKGESRTFTFALDSEMEIVPSQVFHGPVIDELNELVTESTQFSFSSGTGSILLISPELGNELLPFFQDSLFVIGRGPRSLIISDQTTTSIFSREDGESIPVLPVGNQTADPQLEALIARQAELVKVSGITEEFADIEELGSAALRAYEQTLRLEREYVQLCRSVNQRLKSVLDTESLNEMLYLEIKRRQFENHR